MPVGTSLPSPRLQFSAAFRWTSDINQPTFREDWIFSSSTFKPILDWIILFRVCSDMCRTFRIFVQFPLTLCDTHLCGHANKIILLLSFAPFTTECRVWPSLFQNFAGRWRYFPNKRLDFTYSSYNRLVSRINGITTRYSDIYFCRFITFILTILGY